MRKEPNQPPTPLTFDARPRMKFIIMLIMAACLTLISFAQEHQGVRWSYRTRISVSYDIMPEQRQSAPSYRSVRPPEYPAEAERAGLTGVTKVMFVLKEDGLVYEAKVSSSSGTDLLDQVALAAVNQWRFHSFHEEVGPGARANRYAGPISVEAIIKYELPEE